MSVASYAIYATFDRDMAASQAVISYAICRCLYAFSCCRAPRLPAAAMLNISPFAAASCHAGWRWLLLIRLMIKMLTHTPLPLPSLLLPPRYHHHVTRVATRCRRHDAADALTLPYDITLLMSGATLRRRLLRRRGALLMVIEEGGY